MFIVMLDGLDARAQLTEELWSAVDEKSSGNSEMYGAEETPLNLVPGARSAALEQVGLAVTSVSAELAFMFEPAQSGASMFWTEDVVTDGDVGGQARLSTTAPTCWITAWASISGTTDPIGWSVSVMKELIGLAGSAKTEAIGGSVLRDGTKVVSRLGSG